MHMVRSTIDRVTNPLAMLARFANLVLNELSLLSVQNLGVFRHFRSGFQLAHRIRQLPTLLIFDPSTLIARKPSSIGRNGNKKSDWAVHSIHPLVTRRVSEANTQNTKVYPLLRVGLPFPAFMRFLFFVPLDDLPREAFSHARRSCR